LEDATISTVQDNLLKKCVFDKYDECVVKAELAAHNDARLARKDTPAMVHDVKASQKLQALLDADKDNTVNNEKFPDFTL
jgi:hypothetical protein